MFSNRQNKPEHGTAVIDRIALDSVGRGPDHRQRVTSVRDYLQVYRVRVVIVLVALASLCAAFLLLRSLPPRTIVMVTGPEGGAYAEVGPRYRQILGRAGIEVKLLPTGGELENLARLRDCLFRCRRSSRRRSGAAAHGEAIGLRWFDFLVRGERWRGGGVCIPQPARGVQARRQPRRDRIIDLQN